MKNLFATLILLLLIFFYFFDAAIFRGFWITGDLGYSDLTDLNWPIKAFLSSSIRCGNLPLWTKDMLCGIPLLAEGEGGFFYPLNLILFLFAKPFFAYNLSILLTFFLTGLFTFLFCTSIRLSFFSCLFAAISFIFSGFFICHLKHPSMIMVASLFPFLFYLTERFIKEQRPIFCILAGIILSFQVFAGHPQIMVYTNLALGIYFVFRLGFLPKEKKKKVHWRALSLLYFLPVMAAIGAGLSAIQLFPTMELLEQSGRKLGGAIHELARFPFHPAELVRFILPYFYGDPYLANHKTPWDGLFWENTAYIGLIPLILAGFALSKIRKNSYILIFAIITLFSLLLSFGKYSPLFFLLKLPPLSSYRFPNRFLLITSFSLAILAAFGMEWFLSKIKQAKMGIIFSCLIIFVCFLDLWRFGHHQNPVAPAKKWLSPPESVKFLRQDTSLYRIYSVGSVITRNNLYFTYGWKDPDAYVKHREVLSVNTNLEHKLSSPGIYLTLFPLRPYIFEMKLGEI
ncbi:YfhO family protein, partial [bacterium]|nr:YfhO family protein [bacterium]